jgi:AraC-like DNA-binding protein
VIDAFLRLPDGAHAPAATPGFDDQARTIMVMKVERRPTSTRWFEPDARGPQSVLAHLPLQGSVRFRRPGEPDLEIVPGELLLERRPRRGSHRNQPLRGVFRNCWTQLGGSALVAAADAVIAAHGPVIDLGRRPEVWSMLHDWFATALRARRADSATLGGLAFAWLARLMGGGASTSGIGSSLDLIEQRLHDPELDVPRLAQAAGCAASTFSRRFRALTGTAPYQYLLQRRIDRARERLFGGEPIAEIARCCGYRDAVHFAHSFRATVGESPNRYRRRYAP